MGSSGLRTSSTDRCDRDSKPQELGIYIYIWRLSSLQTGELRVAVWVPSPPCSVAAFCWELKSESPTKEQIYDHVPSSNKAWLAEATKQTGQHG